MKRQNNFDFIRFSAAIFVVLAHSTYLLNRKDLFEVYTKGAYTFGSLGVAIFLIISGYLVSSSYMNSSNLSKYILNRILRIFPGLFIMLIFSVLVIGSLCTSTSIIDYFSNENTYFHLVNISLYFQSLNISSVFSSNYCHTFNGSLWTLPYEFSFYFLIIFIGSLKLFTRRYLFLILSFVFFSFRVYLGSKIEWFSYSTPYLLGLNIKSFIDLWCYFLLGILFFLFKDKIKFSLNESVFIILILVVVSSIFTSLSLITMPILLTYIILQLSFIKCKLNNFGFFGDFSYGIYIYSYPIQQAIIYYYNNEINPYFLFFLSTLISIVIAYFSWHLVEKKALLLKNHSFLKIK